MTLFQKGPVTLHSGLASNWKIECDSLTPDDWDGLAVMAVERFGQPGDVVGVPRGGLPFAQALKPYRCFELGCLWIVDDVLTTGGSMESARSTARVAEHPCDGQEPFGLVAFARASTPGWVEALFTA